MPVEIIEPFRDAGGRNIDPAFLRNHGPQAMVSLGPRAAIARGQVSMIKINLLPVKAAKRREQGQRQLLIGVIVVSRPRSSSIIVFHGTQVARINELREHNTQLSKDIARLKAEIGDYDVIKAQRDELIRQRDAIRRLQANRAGPTFMMRELSDILTPGKGPTFNKEQYEETIKRNPNAGFNPNWDTRRAWLISYAEQNHSVKIKGGAKSDEDVAEFLKRLQGLGVLQRRLLAADEAGDRREVERLVRDVRRDVPGELLMQNFFDRIAALQLAAEARHHRRARRRSRAAATGTSSTATCWTSRRSSSSDQTRLEKEKKDYEKRKQEYLAFRNEVNALLEEQKELLRVLPEGGRHRAVHRERAGADRAGRACRKVESMREAAQPVEMYVKIPIKMSLTGTYHQINHFFKQVGDLKRIVNIEDLSLDPARRRGDGARSANQLKANFTATTFSSSTRAARRAARRGTSITSGGGK